jgi:hypothetical protein
MSTLEEKRWEIIRSNPKYIASQNLGKLATFLLLTVIITIIFIILLSFLLSNLIISISQNG